MAYYLYQWTMQYFFTGLGFSLGVLPVLAALLYLNYRLSRRLDEDLWRL